MVAVNRNVDEIYSGAYQRDKAVSDCVHNNRMVIMMVMIAIMGRGKERGGETF